MRRNRLMWRGIAAIAITATSLGCESREADVASAPPPVASTTLPVSEAPQPMIVQFTPPPPAYAGELPPLPTSPYEPPRPPDVVRAVYTFAARHPEVLHYVPCFCGCQRSGHKDNDDCFIQSRDTKGRPTWDPHGMT